MALSIIQTAVPATQAVVAPSKAFTSNVTAGSPLFAILYIRDATAASVTDTQGNTWVVAGNPTPGTFADNTRQCALCYAENAKAGATTVTGHSGGGTALIDMMIGEASGFTGTGLLESVIYTFTSGSTARSSGAITTSRNPDALILAACVTRDVLVTGSSGDGYTIMQEAVAFNGNSAKDKIVSATGVQAAATWTDTGTVGAWMLIASLTVGVPAPSLIVNTNARW